MHRFFRSPLFRCLVCLILVCCILVNVSPIRAKATATAMTAIVGTAAAVACVAGAMQCLGIMPDSTDSSVFQGVVNDCVDALTASGVFLNGMLSVLQLTDGVIVKNYVNQGIIEAILDWLFANDIVKETESITWSNDIFDCSINGTSYALQCNTNSSGIPVVFKRLVTDSSFGVYHGYEFYMLGQYGCYVNGKYYSSSYLGNYYGIRVSSIGSWLDDGTEDPWNVTSYSGFIDLGLFEGSTEAFNEYLSAYDFAGIAGVAGGIGVAAGLTTGQIGTDVETDYETWVQDGVIAVDFGIGYVDDPNTNQDDDNEDDEETGGDIATVPPDQIVDPNNPVEPTTAPSPWWQNNRWLNIGGAVVGTGLGIYTNYLLNQTQSDVQTGVGDPQTQVDTSLFGNSGNGNNTIVTDPDTGDSSDPSDHTTPSVPEDMGAYTFDLKDFFPFCIPFDLYDFFSVLAAEPEAPQFHWEIQDLSGRVYSIDIDLTPWNDLAEFFRLLQLLLFITGLAAASRKFIKW